MNQKLKLKKSKSMTKDLKKKVNSRRRNLFGLVVGQNGDSDQINMASR